MMQGDMRIVVHDFAVFHKPLPVSAVGGTSGHGTQEVSVDLDDLLDGPRPDVHASCGSAVHGQEDAALVLEAQGRGAVIKVHGDVFAGVILQHSEKKSLFN